MSRSKVIAGALILGGIASLVYFMTPKRRKHITDAAEAELKRWQGGITETTATGTSMVKEYWANGAHQWFPGVDKPWSAAFISYVTNKGDPGSLEPSGSHMLYAEYALEGKGKYRVQTVGATKVKAGDLILRNRAGGTLTFSDIGHGHADSHADLVTKVSKGTARAIGGNKNNAVQVENYKLKADGTLDDPRAIAILKFTG